MKTPATAASALLRWKKFFQEDLWHFDFTELTRVRKSFYQSLQVLVLVSGGFFKDKLLLRASALTYSSLLAIVPFFALLFSVLKSLGFQRYLEPLLLKRVSESAAYFVSQVLAYIDRVKVKSLGSVGLLILAASVFAMLNTIESSFNDIWGLSRSRSFPQKIVDYLFLLILMPLLLFLDLSLTASLKSTVLVLWLKAQPGLGPMVVLSLRLFPYVSLWAWFTMVFFFMPNTRVRFSSALAAGIFTGTLWQITQWAYVTFQVVLTRHSVLYGTFAQLPILFLWIYLSWVIVLFGAELSFALQNLNTYRQETRSGSLHFAARTELAITLLGLLHSRFQTARQPQSAEALARHQELPVRLVSHVLDELATSGFLQKRGERNPAAYEPVPRLDKIPVASVLERLEQNGMDLKSLGGKQAAGEKISGQKLLARATLARRAALRGKVIGDLQKK